MANFVIRSMSTTDYRCAGYGLPEQKPVPYHIYLAKPEKRGSAWWTTSLNDLARYETEADAQAEYDRLFAEEKYSKPQIVPVDADARGIPSYWEEAA